MGRDTKFARQTELSSLSRNILEITVKFELEVITVLLLWKLMEILNYLPFPVLVCVIGFAAQ